MSSANFESCPREIHSHIFSFLDIKTASIAGEVSKGWSVLSNEDLLWRKFFRQMDEYTVEKIGLNISRLDLVDQEEITKMVATTKVFFSKSKGEDLEEATDAQLILSCLSTNSLKKVDEYVIKLPDAGGLTASQPGQPHEKFNQLERLEKITYEYLKYNRLADAKVCLKKVSLESFYARIARAIFDKYIENNDLDGAREIKEGLTLHFTSYYYRELAFLHTKLEQILRDKDGKSLE